MKEKKNGKKIMISNELKEKFRGKKNLISVIIFATIIFILKFKGHSSIWESILGTAYITIIMMLIFSILKWVLWKFLKPINPNEEIIKKKKEFTNKVAFIFMSSLILFMMIFQFLKFTGTIDYSGERSNSFYQTNKIHEKDLQTETTNIHSNLNSCESLRSRFQSCVSRSYRGLECFPGTDIVLPKKCKD